MAAGPRSPRTPSAGVSTRFVSKTCRPTSGCRPCCRTLRHHLSGPTTTPRFFTSAKIRRHCSATRSIGTAAVPIPRRTPSSTKSRTTASTWGSVARSPTASCSSRCRAQCPLNGAMPMPPTLRLTSRSRCRANATTNTNWRTSATASCSAATGKRATSASSLRRSIRSRTAAHGRTSSRIAPTRSSNPLKCSTTISPSTSAPAACLSCGCEAGKTDGTSCSTPPTPPTRWNSAPTPRPPHRCCATSTPHRPHRRPPTTTTCAPASVASSSVNRCWAVSTPRITPPSSASPPRVTVRAYR